MQICGFDISTRDCAGHIALLRDKARAGDGAWVVTLNLEMLARIGREPAYGTLIGGADLFTADGAPIVWAVRKKGADLAGRTTGVDFIDGLLRSGDIPPFAIIGGVDPRTTLRLYDGAEAACVYLFDGKVGLEPEDIAAQAEALRASGAQMLFLALGVPKQDHLARALRKACPHLVILGLGGTFEILGPQGARAPLWMQKTGLEWAYRLLREPGRLWRRYLVQYPRGAVKLLGDLRKSA